MLPGITRFALQRGMAKGSRSWLMVGGLAVTLRLVRKLTKNEPEVVYSDELPVGRSLIISNGEAAMIEE